MAKQHLGLKTSKQSKISIFVTPFKSLHGVYNGRELHQCNWVDYAIDITRELCFFPDRRALEERYYMFKLVAGMAVLTIFWATIAANTYEASQDIVSFGENTMFLLGVSLIYFKLLVFILRCNKIEAIETTLKWLFLKQGASPDPRIRKLQRSFFVKEGLVCVFFHTIGIFLFFTLSVQPFFTEQSTPLPALFPCDLQNGNLHPLGAKFIYFFQVAATFYGLFALLSVDTAGIDCIVQISLNLRILVLQLRSLGKQETLSKINRFRDDLRELVAIHQTIIDLVDQINDAFHVNFLLQMGLSTFMLGLASFEALLAKDDLMIAFKFVFFMCASASQLLYWCFVGNLAYFDSLEVAVAAYDVHEWFTHSPADQRNLSMMIMRAQQPLMFRAKPFFPFTVETFTKIIRTSYTSFTLLCNTHE